MVACGPPIAFDHYHVWWPKAMKANQTKNERIDDYTPTWEAAVQIYMAVLENPHASNAGKAGARAEITKLARFADRKATTTATATS
jgi:hypothetical protein